MTKRSKLPPLDDLLGRKVTHEGHEWTIRLTRDRGLVLERRVEGVAWEEFVDLVREGKVVPVLDQAQVDEAISSDGKARERERAVLRAALEGQGKHAPADPQTERLIRARLARLEAAEGESGGSDLFAAGEDEEP